MEAILKKQKDLKELLESEIITMPRWPVHITTEEIVKPVPPKKEVKEHSQIAKEEIGKHAIELLREDMESLTSSPISKARATCIEEGPTESVHHHEPPSRPPKTMLISASSHDVKSDLEAIDFILAKKLFVPYYDEIMLLHVVEHGEELVMYFDWDSARKEEAMVTIKDIKKSFLGIEEFAEHLKWYGIPFKVNVMNGHVSHAINEEAKRLGPDAIIVLGARHDEKGSKKYKAIQEFLLKNAGNPVLFTVTPHPNTKSAKGKKGSSKNKSKAKSSNIPEAVIVENIVTDLEPVKTMAKSNPWKSVPFLTGSKGKEPAAGHEPLFSRRSSTSTAVNEDHTANLGELKATDSADTLHKSSEKTSTDEAHVEGLLIAESHLSIMRTFNFPNTNNNGNGTVVPVLSFRNNNDDWDPAESDSSLRNNNTDNLSNKSRDSESQVLRGNHLNGCDFSLAKSNITSCSSESVMSPASLSCLDSALGPSSLEDTGVPNSPQAVAAFQNANAGALPHCRSVTSLNGCPIGNSSLGLVRSSVSYASSQIPNRLQPQHAQNNFHYPYHQQQQNNAPNYQYGSAFEPFSETDLPRKPGDDKRLNEATHPLLNNDSCWTLASVNGGNGSNHNMNLWGMPPTFYPVTSSTGSNHSNNGNKDCTLVSVTSAVNNSGIFPGNHTSTSSVSLYPQPAATATTGKSSSSSSSAKNNTVSEKAKTSGIGSNNESNHHNHPLNIGVRGGSTAASSDSLYFLEEKLLHLLDDDN